MDKVVTLYDIGYKWYRDKGRPIASRVTSKMHRFMIFKFDGFINEPRITL